jgi:hypothetical protein
MASLPARRHVARYVPMSICASHLHGEESSGAAKLDVLARSDMVLVLLEPLVMRVPLRGCILVGAMFSSGCAGSVLVGGRDAVQPAITALQEGRFEEAERLAVGERNPYARVTRAIVRYKKTAHQFALDARTLVAGLAVGGVNQKYLQATFDGAEKELAAVDDDLAVAALDPNLSIELCVACWEIDWNGDGRIDRRDRLLFQIENDERGAPIPVDDPRRKPTFRFDAGDVAWARAFVGFQRAALDVLLAYDFSEAGALAEGHDGHAGVVLRLVHPERVVEARRLILEALDQSDLARRSYLAETDDDREWVPNPRQKSHPMQLPVDEKLYGTWEAVLGDVRRLIRSEEGLAIADLVARGDGPDHHGRGPGGYLDVGSMLSHPHDITVDLDRLERLRGHDARAMLSALFGDHYVASMKRSPLPARLLRMQGEVDRNEETFEHKLRYLFWLN